MSANVKSEPDPIEQLEVQYWIRLFGLTLGLASIFGSIKQLSDWAKYILENWQRLQDATRDVITNFLKDTWGLHFNFYNRSTFAFCAILVFMILLGLSNSSRRANLSSFLSAIGDLLLRLFALRPPRDYSVSMSDATYLAKSFALYTVAVIVALGILAATFFEVRDRAFARQEKEIADFDALTVQKCGMHFNDLMEAIRRGGEPFGKTPRSAEWYLNCLGTAVKFAERIEADYYTWSKSDVTYVAVGLTLFVFLVLVFPLDVIGATLFAVAFLFLGTLDLRELENPGQSQPSAQREIGTWWNAKNDYR